MTLTSDQLDAVAFAESKWPEWLHAWLAIGCVHAIRDTDSVEVASLLFAMLFSRVAALEVQALRALAREPWIAAARVAAVLEAERERARRGPPS